jgi:sphingosine kinase
LPEDLNYKPKNPNFQIICNKNNYKDNNNSQIKSNLDFNYLTPLNEPVPNDWITIEDNFSFFLIINLPFLASDLFVTPDSKNDDGIMYLVFIRDDVSRFEILKGFTDGSSGNFLKNPCIEFVRCKAFRLEPMKCLQTNKVEGTLMVDGELIEYGPIQGEIKPKLARVLLNK